MSRTLTGRAPKSRRSPAFTESQLTVAWQAASLLLGYPDEELLGRLDLIRQASLGLPDRVGEPLRACVAQLEATPLTELEADYVETFDTRRRHNLFLTYFAHGDTRKRGMALLRFKQTYLASGFELTDTELPDHLCVVLEYAATIDHDRGRQLLLDHRAGLELLRIALGESGSRWAGAVEAVTATLPPLQGDEWDAVRRLAAEGPPEEEVGLTPYETPAFDPGPARPDGPISLPMPSFRARSHGGES
ncbi:nitrate reductase molybdenum cofactor assembly chaperone [Nocardioides szechwanensis]|uniref:Respiratory nitrate reductase chaperone NarJ n=1 Tax=Nocardioides szechwanensis TaxID=1005944 RepID=A0A1H0A819_9ACTN|nr:nitrate reductase molybdenum cofactor assembly chaperone [Nocardioides szechwanensis]GEP34934.1 nitrate reductase molybdenum cofactor assembly chaperone [Nocardioides szechwanensis]SDN29680.1 respiratory nitrate reductase chaperone NarJ [Nocardioides szechwanensis]